ncbi:hypothetical protein IIV31_122R [Armadillidium vulgare iridescent virus]|uniref:Uncharacterized protein n=1 Tax=Armadillidium vulgare iridescent virus TaxID=72201 RepID=A0A068QLQ6_9VIRU|nr:hypothetical protein IIV31_122R [Armadillidium vulgare iridescent virus]CCV02494.1 hypothetical protein IIV31_122R [Armadillidium vulgare iridescent virus]
MSVHEIISVEGINTETEVGTVYLTGNKQLLVGVVYPEKENEEKPITEDEPIISIISLCMFLKQFKPFNVKIFLIEDLETPLTFVRVREKDPAFFVCRSKFIDMDKLQRAFIKWNINVTQNNENKFELLIIGT